MVIHQRDARIYTTAAKTIFDPIEELHAHAVLVGLINVILRSFWPRAPLHQYQMQMVINMYLLSIYFLQSMKIYTNDKRQGLWWR